LLFSLRAGFGVGSLQKHFPNASRRQHLSRWRTAYPVPVSLNMLVASNHFDAAQVSLRL
jgi:hypothetical protein